MPRKLLTITVLAAAIVVAGCGSSDDSASEADTQGIEVLVTELNRVTQEKDPEGFCDVMQPSQIENTFHSKARCVTETKKILEQAGEQPVLNIENIEVDGNTAEVQFAGKAGTAIFVKEDSKWYVPFSTGMDTPATGTTDTGTDGSEG